MRRFLLHSSLSLALLIFGLSARSAHAAWSTNPSVNNPVCVEFGDASLKGLIQDGSGGAFVAWDDRRAGGPQPYVQRIGRDGTPAPGWPVNGQVATSSVSATQGNTAIATDGADGVFVAWQDVANPIDHDIYVQHITAAGTVFPGWPSSGRKVSNVGYKESLPQLLADGSGGVYVIWELEYVVGDLDLYANHLTAAGAPVTGWLAGGNAVDAAVNLQSGAVVTSDGSGGMLVAYRNRQGTTDRVAVCRVPAGAPTVLWQITDLAGPAGAAGVQSQHHICTDGAGGCFVAWADSRYGTARDIFAQRVNGGGATLWSSGGHPIEIGSLFRSVYDLISDGAGGAMLLTGAGSVERSLHHLQSGPGDAPGWPTSLGMDVTYGASLALDGSGGVYASAPSSVSFSSDIRAMRVTAAGTQAVGWNYEGSPVGTAGSNQWTPLTISDATGGAIVVFEDYRTNATTSGDIYAQRIDRFAALGDAAPTLTSVRDVAGDQGGFVRLQWNASYLDQPDPGRVNDYRIWRQTPTAVALSAKRAGALLVDSETSTDALEAAFASGRRVLRPDEASALFAWEYVTTQPANGYGVYSYVAATTSDSLPARNPRTVFMVQARSTSGAFWDSAPDSGFSVDNLPPLAPAPFTGTYTPGSTSLSWGANHEADLSGYRLYRGATVGFVPGPGNLVLSTSSTAHLDVGAGPAIYKLAAVDLHGNESGYSTLVPVGTLDTPGQSLPTEVWFGAPSQNPVRSGTTLRFGLPRAGAVTLALYDHQGRRVRTLIDTALPAGEHDSRWDGTDDQGRRVAPGMYFARFVAGGRAFTRRLVALQ